MTNKTDQKTLDLIKELNRQKAEIARLEKPNWKTNCSFLYLENNLNGSINLHVESNIQCLIKIAAFLREKERSYNETALMLDVENAPKFTWCGFSSDDWIEDIQTRINKLKIAAKKEKFETLNARLNAIISPTLRAELELEAIANELK